MYVIQRERVKDDVVLGPFPCRNQCVDLGLKTFVADYDACKKFSFNFAELYQNLLILLKSFDK